MTAPDGNVLFIVADQLRADVLNGPLAACVPTPNLDRLAAEGVSFDNHFTVAVPCGPARASLLTGLYAMNHRSIRNGTPLAAHHDNLALALRRAGREPLLFGYTDGATFCQKLVKKHRKYDIVTSAFGDLPESSEQVLHPEKYLAEERDHPHGLPVLGGAGERLRKELEQLAKEEAERGLEAGEFPPESPEMRVVVLGHIQRGGTPDPRDRVIATACGSHAVEMVASGRFGRMSCWLGEGPGDVPLVEATVPHLVQTDSDPLVQIARSIGICLGDSADS